MQNAKPFFSIVLPCYNRASMLQESVRSVLAQTFSSFELIIVDDGSTDNTRETVERFGDPRIRYFHKINEERSIARNFGISKALGEYVNFLDSDDFFYTHHLQTAYDFLRITPSPILHTGFEIINADNVVIQKRNTFDGSTVKKLIDDNSLQCNSIFVNREIALKHQFLPDKKAVIAEDWYLWLVLGSRFTISFSNTITCAVREHDQRSLNSLSPTRVSDSFDAIFHALENDTVFLNFYGRKAFAMFKAKNSCFAALIAALNGNRLEAKSLLLRAFKTDSRIVFHRAFLAVAKKIVWR